MFREYFPNSREVVELQAHHGTPIELKGQTSEMSGNCSIGHLGENYTEARI